MVQTHKYIPVEDYVRLATSLGRRLLMDYFKALLCWEGQLRKVLSGDGRLLEPSYVRSKVRNVLPSKTYVF